MSFAIFTLFKILRESFFFLLLLLHFSKLFTTRHDINDPSEVLKTFPVLILMDPVISLPYNFSLSPISFSYSQSLKNIY